MVKRRFLNRVNRTLILGVAVFSPRFAGFGGRCSWGRVDGFVSVPGVDGAGSGRAARGGGGAARAQLFLADLSQDDREAIDAALTVLLDDPSLDVRRTLAETLALYETAPRHLIVALAGDLADVAEPVFRRSPSLLDAELIEGIRGGSPIVQRAIARRPWVSEAVSAVLVQEGEAEAVLALLKNAGSDVTTESFELAAARFGAEPEVRAALFSRRDLPIHVRQSIIATLAQRLDQLVPTATLTIPQKRLDAIARDACDRATVMLAAQADEDGLEDLVDHLCQSGQLTTTLLVRAIAAGQIRFFEAALARLSEMPAARVFALLSSGRERPLSALFLKAGLPERAHPVFHIALEIWRRTDWEEGYQSEKRFARQMVDRIVAGFQAGAPHEVEDILALLRRIASEAAREAARATLQEARRLALGANPEDLMISSDLPSMPSASPRPTTACRPCRKPPN